MPVAGDTGEIANVLWIDDQIAVFGPHIANLEDAGYRVIAVATADEALSTIRRGDRFDAILVDLKMPNHDGISLLADIQLELSHDDPPLLVALSSFLYDENVRRRLVTLNMNVALLDKKRAHANRDAAPLADRIRALLERETATSPARDQFIRWDEDAQALSPFAISLEAYLERPMVVRLQLDEKAQHSTAHVRSKLVKQGIVWACFCGSSSKPILSVADVADIPSEDEVFARAISEGHPPYEFYCEGEFEELTTEDESEDTSQAADIPGPADSTCPGAPDYPYFRVEVTQRSDGPYAYRRSRDFHFDSGLDITAFDLEAALKLGLTVDTDKPVKVVRYADVEYRCYSLSGKAYIDRQDLGAVQVSIAGRAYLNWTESPFARRCATFRCEASLLCHRRHALLGRNLLVENQLLLDVRPMGGR